jgi:hypothetical protein
MLHSGVDGELVEVVLPAWSVLYRSCPATSCRPGREVAGQALGFLDGGWLYLGRFPLGGGGRQRRAKIQEREELGRRPGRYATAEGFFYFDSNKSRCAMGFL